MATDKVNMSERSERALKQNRGLAELDEATVNKLTNIVVEAGLVTNNVLAALFNKEGIAFPIKVLRGSVAHAQWTEHRVSAFLKYVSLSRSNTERAQLSHCTPRRARRRSKVIKLNSSTLSNDSKVLQTLEQLRHLPNNVVKEITHSVLQNLEPVVLKEVKRLAGGTGRNVPTSPGERLAAIATLSAPWLKRG